jgi:hypothetical protein
MSGQTSDSYEQLLGEWQAKRELVDAYHRALHFLASDLGDSPERLQARRRDLNQKMATTLVAARQTTDRLQRFEEGRAPASSH